MKVYILHHVVEYEFGRVLGVYTTRRKAKEALEDLTVTRHYSGNFPSLGIPMEEMDIKEWEVTPE